jgi:hypothetical protein
MKDFAGSLGAIPTEAVCPILVRQTKKPRATATASTTTVVFSYSYPNC